MKSTNIKTRHHSGFWEIVLNRTRLALDLTVERVTTKEFVILLLFDAVGLLLLVTSGHVAGDRLSLSAGFGAF